MGLPRTVWHSASYVGAAWRAVRWRARTMAPRVSVSPRRWWKSVAILPNETPNCLLSVTANASACGPSWTAAAPSASEVCQG